MMKTIRRIGYLLLIISILPILSSCNNEDDVIEIFTGKTWKLARLTTKGSSQPFLPNLWSNEKDYNSSMDALRNNGYFTLNFEGSELNGEILGTSIVARGIQANLSGTWKVNKESRSLTISAKITGSDKDPLAKAFLDGLTKVTKYEGDSRSLTLYIDDGHTTKIMGFTPLIK